MASLAEWLSVRLRTKWLCVRISLSRCYNFLRLRFTCLKAAIETCSMCSKLLIKNGVFCNFEHFFF